MSNDLTLEQFVRVLPKNVKKSVNQELIDSINNVFKNPEMRDQYRENLLSYTNVMVDGKFKIQSYLEAVKYVSFKLLGASNIEAYTKTFPDRYQRMVDNKVSDKDIASAVTAYNKNKLVNLIYEQTLVPTHVLNADLYQKALNTQAELMMTANSEKVRCDAANSILVHLKRPETQKVELDVGIKEDKSLMEIRQATLDLAAQQRKMIQAGAMTAGEVAESKVIEAEYEKVD